MYYYFNKSIRNPTIRDFLFRLIRHVVPKGSVPANIDSEMQALLKDGILLWERLISAGDVERIRDYLMTKPVYEVLDIYKKPLDLAVITKVQQVKLKYYDTDIAHCDDIMRLANDPKILSFITSYFGCKPTITLMDAWWTKTAEQATPVLYQDDMYHRDVADFKFIKLFLYLTDVTLENGAHCFVRGSHHSSKLVQRRPFADNEVDQAFDAADCLTLTGNAGCGFLEDTWGLHRSLPAKQGERLVVSITYSITAFNPWSPKIPSVDNIYGVDSYINRVYLKKL